MFNPWIKHKFNCGIKVAKAWTWCSSKCSLHWYFTLGCTPASVSSPPVEPQRPRCRHNVERSLVFQVASGNWWTKITHLKQRELWSQIFGPYTYTLAPAMLPNLSWRMDSTFHTVDEKAWGFSMRREQPLWKAEIHICGEVAVQKVCWCSSCSELKINCRLKYSNVAVAQYRNVK